MFFEFAFKVFEQRERVGGSAREAGNYLVVIEPANFARGAFNNDVAQGDLTARIKGV